MDVSGPPCSFWAIMVTNRALGGSSNARVAGSPVLLNVEDSDSVVTAGQSVTSVADVEVGSSSLLLDEFSPPSLVSSVRNDDTPSGSSTLGDVVAVGRPKADFVWPVVAPPLSAYS